MYVYVEGAIGLLGRHKDQLCEAIVTCMYIYIFMYVCTARST